MKFYRAAIRKLREEWDYDEEECGKMEMSFLQKVARSGCYIKSDYAIDRMMEARHWQVQSRDLRVQGRDGLRGGPQVV